MSRFLGNAEGRTTGPVPPPSTGDAVLLFNCSGCWNGSLVIPPEKLGVYGRYEITGRTGYWSNYCSHMALQFGGACGGTCSDNFQDYCCTQCSCGWVGDHKCFDSSYQYSCAGSIPWIFGCGSGCLTACSVLGFLWKISIQPENVCCGDQRGFRYCSAASMNGSTVMCCTGMRNSGFACNCCGAHPACLKAACITATNGSNSFACVTGVRVYGYGKINV